MKILVAALTLSLACWSMPAIADTTTPVDPHAPDAIKCRKFDVTGSLMRKVRVCKTNAEWTKIREAEGRDAAEVVQRGTTGMDCRTNGSC